MRRQKLYIVLLFGLFSIVSSAQVNVNVKMDSLELFIGEQTTIHVEVSANSSQNIVFPVFTDTIVRGVECIESQSVDTLYMNDGKRISITRDYVITSFDAALYYIPPFKVVVDNKSYESKSLALKVLDVEVDTVHTDQFFGPKDVMAPEFSWDDWKVAFFLSVLLVALLLGNVYLYVRYKDNKPIIKRILRVVKVSPHKKALQTIERIKSENLQTTEDAKEYYTQLTDALRTYMFERYGFNAMEMTSSEIIEHLRGLADGDLAEIRALFETADLVKFARYNTLINENDANLVSAMDFINQTKIEEAETKAEVRPEYTPEDLRSKRMKMTIICVIMASVVLMIGMFVYIVWDVYQLIS